MTFREVNIVDVDGRRRVSDLAGIIRQDSPKLPERALLHDEIIGVVL